MGGRGRTKEKGENPEKLRTKKQKVRKEYGKYISLEEEEYIRESKTK